MFCSLLGIVSMYQELLHFWPTQ